MPQVPTTQIINDFKDTYVVLAPFLTDLNLRNHGKYREDTLLSLLGEAKEAYENLRILGNLEKYILYHNYLKTDLKSIKDYQKIIFTTGVSVNLTTPESGIPRKLATDPFADSFALTTRFLERYYKNPKAYENVLIIPIAPIIWPYEFYDGKIHHFRKDIVREVNYEMMEKDKLGFGATEKGLDTRTKYRANFEFSEEAFDLERRIHQSGRSTLDYIDTLDPDEVRARIEYEVFFNLLLMENAFGNVIESLNLEEVNLFSMQTSYAATIMNRLSISRGITIIRIGGKEGCMRNIDRGTSGESEQSAINLFNGFLLTQYINRTQEPINLSSKPRPKGESKTIEPLSCPFYPFFLCPAQFQRKCRTIDDCCSHDYFSSLDKESLTILRDDTKKFHFGIEGIETIVHELMAGRDFDVFDPNYIHKSWVHEVQGKELRLTPKFDVAEEKDMRPSGFSRKGPVSRFIGIYKDNFPVQFENSREAISGNILHEIMFKQKGPYKHNKILESVGLPETGREFYCEKPSLYQHNGVRLLGHFDSSFLLDEDIVILDAKRSRKTPYPRFGYRYQLLAYALGIKNCLNLNPRNYYLTLINRPFEEELPENPAELEGLHKPQEFTIIKVPSDSSFIQSLNSKIEEQFEEDQRLLKGTAYFFRSLEEELPLMFEDEKKYALFLKEQLVIHRNLDEFLESISVGKL